MCIRDSFTQLTIAIGFVVGGSFLIETLFQYQGIGYVLSGAIAQRDYPVMQGVFLVITMSVILANLLADFLYGWLDPVSYTHLDVYKRQPTCWRIARR